MIHLDTSFLIRAGVGEALESHRLRAWKERNEQIRISAVAWAEFACGPISHDALEATAELFGKPEPLTGYDATLAAQLFHATGRRRASLPDCMIAASAIHAGASLATSNRKDFERFTALGLSLA